MENRQKANGLKAGILFVYEEERSKVKTLDVDTIFEMLRDDEGKQRVDKGLRSEGARSENVAVLVGVGPGIQLRLDIEAYARGVITAMPPLVTPQSVSIAIMGLSNATSKAGVCFQVEDRAAAVTLRVDFARSVNPSGVK